MTAAAPVIQARKTSACMGFSYVLGPGASVPRSAGRAYPRASPALWEPLELELASPAQGGRVHRRVPQPGERVCELADRHRKSLHLQAGDVVAHQVPGDPCPLALQVPLYLTEDHVQFQQWRA